MQKFWRIVLNKVIFLLFINLFLSPAFAQQISDISLDISIEPRVMYLGQEGVITFTVTNTGIADRSITGVQLRSVQADGSMAFAELDFIHDSLSAPCYYSIDLEPIDTLGIIEIPVIEENSSVACSINFIVPEETTESFIAFTYDFSSIFLSDPNPNNNTANVRINIQPRTTSVPTLNLWGLLILVLGLLLLVKYRQKMLF